MFEWVLGAIIGIILLGFAGWIPALIGYFIGCIGGGFFFKNIDEIASIGFLGAFIAIMFPSLPVCIWLGHEIVIRLL